MIRRPPRSTQSRSSAASDVYKRQHEDVVAPLEVAGPLDDADVLRLLDHADHAAISPLVAAVGAGVDVGDAVADRAVGDAVLDVTDRVAQALGVLARRAQDVKREALRALPADAGQALKLLD